MGENCLADTTKIMPPKKQCEKKPKEKSQVTKISKKTLALIWWVQSGTKSIVAASKLPAKNRSVDSIVKVGWDNSDTKKKEYYEAKIIAFDSK